ncbi:HD domain-containing protein [Niallia sp. Krafla_26]|uniref:HD domain-containing protein n=1 Tax=Niallia sp. Krafla_26 TaxID=3064703 RepID=UPI003D16F14F
MELIEKAIGFAAKAHQNQARKGTDIPYITHPYAVGMLLQKAECSEEVIAAGILHDTLEDTETTLTDLIEAFGVHIAILVQAATEIDKRQPWEVRKQHTIDKLKEASIEEIQVIVADKLHNLRSIRADLNLHGDSIWQRFNRGKRDQHWYYASIVKSLSPRKNEFNLILELEEEVKGVFGTLDILSEQEISFLFSCAYLHVDHDLQERLESKQLHRFAEELMEEAENLYRNQDERITEKLNELQSRGIEFQSNSEGPFILTSFCMAFQHKMQWSDQELFKQVKNNLSLL